MKIRISAQLLVAITMIVNAGPAHAFGHEGHEEVGAIADQLLQGTAAGAKVSEILNGMHLEQAAIWADCVKGVSRKDDGAFVYKNNDKTFPECIPFGTDAWQTRNVAFVSHNWTQCGAATDHQKCHDQYHYADISVRRDHYDSAYVGANDHDIVHSINAAIAKLRDQPLPGTFQLADKQEALMILAHYVGDIHQPLHVAAIYLDTEGRVLDPDVTGYQLANDTSGGNLVGDGSVLFHHEWDAIPADLNVGGAKAASLLAMAKTVAPSTGDMLDWSTQWATDTIVSGKMAFDRVRFFGNPYSLKAQEWSVWGQDDVYRADADALKAVQLAKGGARLAQLLRAIWPDTPPVAVGYLANADLPDVTKWLPPAPAPGGAAQALDDEIFLKTRASIADARGASAGGDDVFDGASFLVRFQSSIGVSLTPKNAPRLVALLDRAKNDAGTIVAPIKKRVDNGGRVRPFVANPAAASCFKPVDLTGKMQDDLGRYGLAESGSYPSTHSLMGMFIGLMFTELTPQHAPDVLARGLEFGQSRVICGFHYQSDVDAGRLAASALFSRLRLNANFNDDLAAARAEVLAAGGR